MHLRLQFLLSFFNFIAKVTLEATGIKLTQFSMLDCHALHGQNYDPGLLMIIFQI